MASVTSRPSPNPSSSSPYDFDDTDESWQYIDYSSGASAAPSSIGFLHSPASGSLNGYAIVGHVSASPQSAPSPLYIGDMEQQQQSTTAVYGSSADFVPQSDYAASDAFAMNAVDRGGYNQDDGSWDMQQQQMVPQQDLSGFQHPGLDDMALFGNDFSTDMLSFDLPADYPAFSDNFNQPMQSDPNVPPWNTEILRTADACMDLQSEWLAPSNDFGSQASESSAPRDSPVNKLPQLTDRVRKGKVEKKKADQQGKFVIMTPDSISAGAGKPNLFDCFDAMKASQRGRKGPLANATKESALQVRRLGACFCCHSRKVKCDKERPCKNCKKLAVQVPQVVCWQFQDFLTVLFPDFIRAHFKQDEMARFTKENIDGFVIHGVEQPCAVELYGGKRWEAKLSIQAKFFTPKKNDVLQHWHLNTGERVELRLNWSLPIGVELDSSAQKDDLRKKIKTYVQAIIKEPCFAEEVTETLHDTCKLPRKCLSIVQRFSERSNSLIVRRALAIYAMHHIMTRHLTVSEATKKILQATTFVPHDQKELTPRVLSRQIKAILDELLMREVQQLFDLFSKALKPKARREWAPCLAAFLVLCLFMEAVEGTADLFVVSQNEISIRHKTRPEYERKLALQICQEVENLPFKQFAYQFHQVYQTHSKDVNAKSFNPLFDDSFAEQGELDGAALEMVQSLKELYYGEYWQDLQWLTADEILPNTAEYPFPMNTPNLYTGRLLSRFLMSFCDESVIFGRPA